jgi:hypothetical protein
MLHHGCICFNIIICIIVMYWVYIIKKLSYWTKKCFSSQLEGNFLLTAIYTVYPLFPLLCSIGVVPRCMLAQRGQNYEHVHIISITQISFSIRIRRSRKKNCQSREQIRRSRVEICWSGSWNSSKLKLKFVAEVDKQIVEVECYYFVITGINRFTHKLLCPHSTSACACLAWAF